MRQESRHSNTTNKKKIINNLFVSMSFGFLIILVLKIVMWQITTFNETATNMIRDINNYANHIIKFDNSIIDSIKIGIDNSIEYIFNKFKNIFSITYDFKLKDYIGNHSSQAENIIKNGSEALYKFFVILLLTVILLVLKVGALFSSIFLYVSSSLLGFLDGLVSRYKRTMEAGRESTFIFHHVSKILLSIPAFLIFFYVAIPVYISPLLINICIAGLLFAGFRVYGSNLKKYM